jgi:beta-galactosidase GanA
MGFSPFAIESFHSTDALGQSYRVLAQLAPLILEHQGDSSMVGVRAPLTFDGVVDTASQDVRLGDYTLHVTFRDPWVPYAEQRLDRHGGLIIQLGAEEFLVAGRGLTVTFSTANATAGIESIWEGEYLGGRWVRHRLLNGDESHQGRHLRIPPDTFSIQRVRLYRYR